LPFEITDALREYDVGEDEAFPYAGEHAWRWDRYEAVQRAWREGDRNARHPGGESLDDIERRLASFVEALPSRHGAGDVVLAIGHGGIFHAALPALMLLPPGIATHHPLRHGESVMAVLEDGGWRCVRWGAVALDTGENA
jgi:probable phosphoglycerate mutase